MNIVQITPGAGAMYCGNCFRDNALVASLRRQGHSVLMVPLYLPLTLDETDETRGTPIFFNGVNVYLEQKSKWFRGAPAWLHRLMASPSLLKWAAGRAAKTRAADVGDITLSMLRGEEGHQARELEELINFLKTQSPPDVICLSNALLVGMARRLKAELAVPIACVLQGEDGFLDGLPEPILQLAWRTLSERARDVDLFIPPTHYFGDLMRRRLGLPAERIRVIHNGINLDGYMAAESAAVTRTVTEALTTEPPLLHEMGERAGRAEVTDASGSTQTFQDKSALSQSFVAGEGEGLASISRRASATPTLGYFARMCREKGLDTLVEAFILLKERNRVPGLKLKIGGGCGPADQPFVDVLRERLKAKALSGDVEFHPNVDRAAKQAFLSSLTVFSVPALYGEAFGLYVIEALASGVPVVQPRHAAFPELIEASGGGVICEPNGPAALADAIEELLLNPEKARALGDAGRKSVREKFNAALMARETLRAFEELAKQTKAPAWRQASCLP